MGTGGGNITHGLDKGQWHEISILVFVWTTSRAHDLSARYRWKECMFLENGWRRSRKDIMKLIILRPHIGTLGTIRGIHKGVRLYQNTL